MLQKFIDNTFYYLFVFTLIFGVVFYDALGFNFVDELCAIALCGLYAYYVFHTPNWSVNKLFMIIQSFNAYRYNIRPLVKPPDIIILMDVHYIHHILIRIT